MSKFAPQNNYQYIREPQLAHQTSIPIDTIIKGTYGTITANHPKNTPTMPQANIITEKQPSIRQEQQTPIKRFDQVIQIDGGRQRIIPRQPPTSISRQQINVPLPPQRRVEYIPYQQRYVQYVQQKVRVPVQKVMTDYYQVEHIIDYVPVEKSDIVYVTQAQEVVDMKLQYVPVEQRIIHIKQQDAKRYGINQQHLNQYYLQQQQPTKTSPILYTFGTTQPQPPSYLQMKNQILSKSRTNYVTSQGYDPNQKLNEIDKVLAASAVRQSRIKKADEQKNTGQQIVTDVMNGFNMKKKQSIYDAIGGGFTEVGKKEGASIRGSSVK